MSRATRGATVYPRTVVSEGDHYVWVKWWESRAQYSALLEPVTTDGVVQLVSLERRTGGDTRRFPSATVDLIPDPVLDVVANQGYTVAEVVDE